MRGEYLGGPVGSISILELPPHARRIPGIALRYGLLLGTTSACAENTMSGSLLSLGSWNYLRMRGEYLHRVDTTYTLMELPPHARRIRGNLLSRLHLLGTTSACAENTGTTPFGGAESRNYLRMRGEYLLKEK